MPPLHCHEPGPNVPVYVMHLVYLSFCIIVQLHWHKQISKLKNGSHNSSSGSSSSWTVWSEKPQPDGSAYSLIPSYLEKDRIYTNFVFDGNILSIKLPILFKVSHWQNDDIIVVSIYKQLSMIIIHFIPF